MKIITVVGIRKSGKTSTVEALCREISSRGQRVGTCKTVFCPGFSIDKPGSNTHRHAKAGAEIVVARARRETTVIQRGEMALSRIAEEFAGCDWLILEGDYRAPVSRVVTAHHAEDALQRQNAHTVCFAGRVADTQEALPLDCFNPLTDAAALLDHLQQHVPDVTPGAWLDEQLPVVAGVSDDGFCQCGCHHHEKKLAREGVTLTVDGEAVQLTDAQRKAILEIVGK